MNLSGPKWQVNERKYYFDNVTLLEFIYIVFTRTSVDSPHRRCRRSVVESLVMCLSGVVLAPCVCSFRSEMTSRFHTLYHRVYKYSNLANILPHGRILHTVSMSLQVVIITYLICFITDGTPLQFSTPQNHWCTETPRYAVRWTMQSLGLHR